MSGQRASVIVPVHNGGSTLRETLDSVLGQTRPPQEIVVVDDGSTDDTPDILASYGPCVRVVRQHKSGRASACNRGVKEAQGDLIAFLDADDIWLPEKLETQLLECGRYIWSYTDSIHFGGTGESRKSVLCGHPHGLILEDLLLDNFITGSSVVIRRDVFLKHGGFDESYCCVQDWPLWIRVAAKHSLGCVPEPLVRYRIHAGQTTNKVHKTLPAHIRVLDEAFAGPAAHLRHLKPIAYANAYRCVAWSALNAGNGPLAVKCSVKAIKLDPWRSSSWKGLARSVIRAVG